MYNGLGFSVYLSPPASATRWRDGQEPALLFSSPCTSARNSGRAIANRQKQFASGSLRRDFPFWQTYRSKQGSNSASRISSGSPNACIFGLCGLTTASARRRSSHWPGKCLLF